MVRVGERRTVDRVWTHAATGAGAGTTRGRDRPLVLERVYSCGWREYSTVMSSDGRAVAIRYLAFEITRRSS